MKKNTKLSGLYLGIVFFLMYLPVAVVIIFSFNESRLPVRFTGFSLKWYQELLNDFPEYTGKQKGLWNIYPFFR